LKVLQSYATDLAITTVLRKIAISNVTGEINLIFTTLLLKSQTWFPVWMLISVAIVTCWFPVWMLIGVAIVTCWFPV